MPTCNKSTTIPPFHLLLTLHTHLHLTSSLPSCLASLGPAGLFMNLQNRILLLTSYFAIYITSFFQCVLADNFWQCLSVLFNIRILAHFSLLPISTSISKCVTPPTSFHPKSPGLDHLTLHNRTVLSSLHFITFMSALSRLCSLQTILNLRML